MTIFTKRLVQTLEISPRRARIIENNLKPLLPGKSVQSTLNTLNIDKHLIEGGRRSGWVVAVEDKGATIKQYFIKDTHHPTLGKYEAAISQLASRLEIGPEVLDVESKGKQITILEEFFPHSLNIRGRTLKQNEIKPLGFAMTKLFVGLANLSGNTLIKHNDERPEHLFILGEGNNLTIRLIDWGRSQQVPFELKLFEDWARHQLGWLYSLLSSKYPLAWQVFINSIASQLYEQIPETRTKALMHSISNAYAGFILDRTQPLIDRSMYKFLGEKFLTFSTEVGSLPLSIPGWNKFINSNKNLEGDELASAYLEYNRLKMKPL